MLLVGNLFLREVILLLRGISSKKVGELSEAWQSLGKTWHKTSVLGLAYRIICYSITKFRYRHEITSHT